MEDTELLRPNKTTIKDVTHNKIHIKMENMTVCKKHFALIEDLDQ